MRKLILTVLTVSTCLLLAEPAGAQRKSRSQVDREFPQARKHDRSVSQRRPKPLPTLAGGTLAPPEPRHRDLPTPATTIDTPAAAARPRGIRARAPVRPPFPTPGTTADLPARVSARPGRLPDARNSRRSSTPGVRRVLATDLSVRSDPDSFYVGSLTRGQHFRVKAIREIRRVRRDGTVFYPCSFYGDAFGSVDMKNVWVNCAGLEPRGKRHPRPRRAVKPEFHKPGRDAPNTVTTREHLRRRFASRILPETRRGGDGRPGSIAVREGLDTMDLYRTFDPRTGRARDLLGTFPARGPNITLKGRYVTRNGEAVVLRYIRVDPTTGERSRLWAVVRRGQVNIISPPR